MLIREQLGDKTVENRSWGTDYRGVVLLYGGCGSTRARVGAAEVAGFDADWQAKQGGCAGRCSPRRHTVAKIQAASAYLLRWGTVGIGAGGVMSSGGGCCGSPG